MPVPRPLVAAASGDGGGDDEARSVVVVRPAEALASRAQSMGAGRQLAETEFQIEKIIKKHLDIYKELISNKITK